jgi:hypothetical protein
MDPEEMLGVGSLLCPENMTYLVAILLRLKYMIGMIGRIPHAILLSVAADNENIYLHH